MQIQTKFEVGERVWTIDKTKTLEIISGIIDGINIEKDGRISYFFDKWCCDYYEEDLIKYDDGETLFNKIKEIDNELQK